MGSSRRCVYRHAWKVLAAARHNLPNASIQPPPAHVWAFTSHEGARSSSPPACMRGILLLGQPCDAVSCRATAASAVARVWGRPGLGKMGAKGSLFGNEGGEQVHEGHNCEGHPPPGRREGWKTKGRGTRMKRERPCEMRYRAHDAFLRAIKSRLGVVGWRVGMRCVGLQRQVTLHLGVSRGLGPRGSQREASPRTAVEVPDARRQAAGTHCRAQGLSALLGPASFQMASSPLLSPETSSSLEPAAMLRTLWWWQCSAAAAGISSDGTQRRRSCVFQGVCGMGQAMIE